MTVRSGEGDGVNTKLLFGKCRVENCRPSHHFVIDFVEVYLAHFVNHIFTLECDKGKACRHKECIQGYQAVLMMTMIKMSMTTNINRLRKQ